MKKRLEKKGEDAESRRKIRALIQSVKDFCAKAPAVQMMDFYCTHCHRDFKGVGRKVVFYPDNPAPIAWYRILCPSGHVAIRRITMIGGDPYFFLSKWVRKYQVMHGDDTLSPEHPWFRYIFPVQWERFNKGREKLYLSNIDLWK